jgi:hypothetical protein
MVLPRQAKSMTDRENKEPSLAMPSTETEAHPSKYVPPKLGCLTYHRAGRSRQTAYK